MEGSHSNFSIPVHQSVTSVMDVEEHSDSDYNHQYFSNGRNRNNDYDMRDIVVPPVEGNRTENGGSLEQSSSRSSGSDAGGSECASDSKKFWHVWTKSRKAEEAPGPTASCKANDDKYNMTHLRRGKCVIFNHLTFDKQQGLTNRNGSEVDVKSIRSTFTGLGFDVIIFDDLKFDKIVKTLQGVVTEDHSQHDCLVVFVLTHGQANELHAYDITYKPSSLFNLFSSDKCSTLAGKPKMFFIQACRGDLYDNGTLLHASASRTQVDGPQNEYSYRIPDHADFLTVYSTCEASMDNNDLLRITMKYLSLGFFSWRNSRNGGCFIQALCKVFNAFAPYKDVLSMLTLVNREVALNYESRSKDEGQNMKKQIPHVCHTLMREIYLTPKFQSTLV